MIKQTIIDWIIRPLKNERGVAALMGVVMGIIIVGTIAFNFLAESRQKQSGAILTYTSTNAFMIAEAGLRYADKCLTETEATCPVALQGEADWTLITNANNITLPFGDGSFTVSFPGSVGNASGAPNDADNIRVISVGTYKGAQRSIQRFISRACVLSSEAVTSCLGTTTNNNAEIDPEPDGTSTVCTTDPDGLVDPLDTLPLACTGCTSSTAGCPDFDPVAHLNGSNYLQPPPSGDYFFCNMDISGSTLVRTIEADGANSDDSIIVANDFTVRDTATLRLSDDAADPDNTDETIITVYGDAETRNLGEIRVNGALSLLVGQTLTMRNSSKINSIQGDPDDATMAVNGNITIRNSALYKGAMLSDGTITIRNNGEVEGAIQGNSVVLQNNATLIFAENSGSNTTAINQCASNDVPPGWSE